jgi:succinyl-CoA synthetase beta subunit
MRLHEYEGAEIFEREGIPVPRRGIAESPEEAIQIAGEIGYPVVIKAQVLVGGRGLAGGVKTASSAEELEEYAANIIGSDIKGLPVRKVLISERAEISKEIYLGITVDGYSGRPVIIVSAEGGVGIEETARQSPEKVVSLCLEADSGFRPYQARGLLSGLGLSNRLLVSCADVLVKLYRVFVRNEALIAEINPLVILPNEGVLAVDAVFEIDNSAISRIKYSVPDFMGRIENSLERRGKEIGVTYVDLDGDIGLISSGAGLGMASMDIIGQRMRPANFLETGGGITDKLLYQCMELLMIKKGLRAVFINIYGGINPIHEGAKGVVRYMKEHNVKVPVVAKALGNLQEETWEIFRSGGVHVVTEAATEKAIDYLFDLVGAG